MFLIINVVHKSHGNVCSFPGIIYVISSYDVRTAAATNEPSDKDLLNENDFFLYPATSSPLLNVSVFELW